MAKKGYSKVYRFAGGIPEWRGFNYPMQVNEKYTAITVKKISPDEVISMINEKNPFILDVRPHFFKKNAIIQGSVTITLIDLADRISEIPKDREIIVTDWAMKQSIAAAKFLSKNGYQVIGILKGGIIRWQLENKPFLVPHMGNQ